MSESKPKKAPAKKTTAKKTTAKKTTATKPKTISGTPKAPAKRVQEAPVYVPAPKKSLWDKVKAFFATLGNKKVK